MKKIIFLCLSLMSGIVLYGQAKKPTIMVVPSDNWCVQNGYTETYDNQGKNGSMPNIRG